MEPMKKKGAISVSGMVTGIVSVIIGVVVIFYLVGGSADSLTRSADNISGSGLPLASLFESNGVVLLILMAGVLLAIIGAVFAINAYKGR